MADTSEWVPVNFDMRVDWIIGYFDCTCDEMGLTYFSNRREAWNLSMTDRQVHYPMKLTYETNRG